MVEIGKSVQRREETGMSNTMKTFKIGFPYVGDRFGGSNMSSMVMAGGLQERGHEVIVMTHGPGRAHDEAKARGLNVIAMPALSSAPGYSRPDRVRAEHLLAAPACAAFARKHGLDIVHTNDLTMLRTWALPTMMARTALIAHWRTSSRASLSVSAALACAKAVISVSGYSKAILPDWAQKKTTVEFNAMETFYDETQRKAARAAVRARLGFPADAILIGVFGNLTKRKRAYALADILERLGEEIDGRPVRGVACGGIVEPRDELFEAKRAAFGLTERLAAPGFVRPVDEWMAACDIILAPAEREPLARNVLEAMAVGVPVIVSDDGGLREIVQDGKNGFLLDPLDTDQWVDRVRRLLNTPSLVDIFVKAGQAVTAELTAAKHAERIEKIYLSAVR